ncbi:protoheme IX farnesyltransferase [Leptolyngbya boryana NIES-2135]|uniref:Protoheme IX farnesyltransferase n=2 Tax=Leptolyngbya boryana TaxID=1184 RepID=A0A1Z4JP83_LEPBY|nr:heme o synthase [Leptolyngbya boryana]MBD2370739.1 protoheme IX farnesyltransferase [Leptolyngbya sp. FACHB-161]MBD2377108.1 protoheme IX farnesyltransferase [Leptolyngbya sp. FACHB-238]MBD2401551.1 protoheme IX farnesyltransferase [Leptolyngbya sp. FACHB-239]MBD2408103.1 protoheme IX farnesyltransferase [Leptolyngbya sp. FACHB-402]BAY58585.1 protoheme IX farnesyltransferase [Leptolyngbya boryana NIES-2135]
MQNSATGVIRHNQDVLQVIKSYWQLTKPRIILLLLITTAGGMWIAAQGQVDPVLLIVTLLSGTFAAGSANTINCLYDRDIDYIMERTRSRPLPSGRVSPRDALIFAITLAVLSFGLLTYFANLLSACLAMSGIFFYVVVYTHWLKRHSTQNIVIGGAAGAIPPLVGWAAVTGDLSWAAWVLFAIIFLWTPPHFWALAIMIREDYAKVGVPMLPVVDGNEPTSKQIFYYTLSLIPVSLLLVYPLHVMGAVYATIALLLGGIFVQKAWKLMQAPSDLMVARSTFKYSILYLMLLCAGMGIDSLPMTHQMVSAIAQHMQTVIGALL